MPLNARSARAHRQRQGLMRLLYAEIVFREVAVQMLLRAVLVDALHAALEDREVALDGVGVRSSPRTYSLTGTVLHRFMLRDQSGSMP